MKKTVIFAILFFLGVIFFEFHPFVKEGRNIIPESVYTGKNCDCLCILNSRPWYSRFNYWFWLWVSTVPILVFSIKNDAPKWKKIAIWIAAFGLCYGFMNLAVHLMWDIRNAPFIVQTDRDMPWQKTWDMPKCGNMADGASTVFALILGWIPASLYVGFWLLVRKISSPFLRRLKARQHSLQPR